MKKQNVIIAGLALALTVGTASLSVAHGPMSNGRMGAPMMGCDMMMGGQYAAGLTVEQQKEVQSIEAKYAQKLTAGESAIRAKGAELDKALADGSTTVATVNNLRNELAGLEQDYWQLRDQGNREISARIGGAYYGSWGWGPDNCRWHDNHNGYMMGRGMMQGRGMEPGHTGGRYCCW